MSPALVRFAHGPLGPRPRPYGWTCSLAGLDERDKHDALEDARIARQVMLALLDELDRTTPARRLQRWVLGRASHPWAGLVDPQADPVGLASAVPDVPPPDPVVPGGPLDVAGVVEAFGAGGSLMTGGRTPRPQQAEMAELVATAFARPGRRRMVEAQTGTGKTLAYLVPAIEAARASGRLSVVAPHSRVLQDQILQTLEDLESTMAP